MKKTLLLVTLILTLTACTTERTVDKVVPADVQQNFLSIIQEQEDIYKSAADQETKDKATEEIGFRYMGLGEYDKSISYYKKILENTPESFVALNNIGEMLYELKDYQESYKYLKSLYEFYSDNAIVIDKYINVLIQLEKNDEALAVIEQFSQTEKGKDNTLFISDLFKKIKKL